MTDVIRAYVVIPKHNIGLSVIPTDVSEFTWTFEQLVVEMPAWIYLMNDGSWVYSGLEVIDCLPSYDAAYEIARAYIMQPNLYKELVNEYRKGIALANEFLDGSFSHEN